ncbi:hypothetical protein [Kordiimonas sp.]|uniref:hypothetical protein n=1 Tax=Kordiimonas sp. TaxID=1970157 RepID=UPI003A937161
MIRLKHTLGLVLLMVAFLGQGIAASADQAGCCAPEMQVRMQQAKMAGMDMPCHGDEAGTLSDTKADTCCKDMTGGPVIADIGSIDALTVFSASLPRRFEKAAAEGRQPDYIPPPPNA